MWPPCSGGRQGCGTGGRGGAGKGAGAPRAEGQRRVRAHVVMGGARMADGGIRIKIKFTIKSRLPRG